MKQVIVMNRNNAKRYSYSEHNETCAIISITDVWSNNNVFQKNPKNGIQRVHHVKFDDVNRGGENCITEEQANAIAKFVKEVVDKVDIILVHCEAGQSRSAGCAAAILKWATGSDLQIYDDPKYTPNSTVYSMVLCALYND